MKSENITGGLDLLGDWLDAKGFTEEAGLCTRAMDEINRLRDKNIEYEQAMMALQLLQRAEADVKLRAENARLRDNDWQDMKTAPTDGTFVIAAIRVYRAEDKSFLHWDVCVIARDTETGDVIEMNGDYCGWSWENFDVWKPVNLKAAADALKETGDE